MTTEVPAARGSPTIRWGPNASYIGPVVSLPFEALYEEVLRERGRRETATGTIYRDSGGRVRREYRIVHGSGQGPIDLVVINDLAARSVVWLDNATNTATRFIDFGPPPGQPLWGGWAFEGSWSVEGGAEEKTIEGVLCRKVARVGWPLGATLKGAEAGEIWISDELKYSVFERVTDPEHEYTWRLHNIRRTEPPDSLFAVPAAYTVVSRSKIDPSG